MIDKYPTSKNGHKCIGPCYPKDTYIIHPNTLHVITSNEESFCPISLLEFDGKEQADSIDACYNPIKQSDISKHDLSMDIIDPKIIFNCHYFLVIYNNISSYNDFIEWLDINKTEPILTKKRIVNCAFGQYGKDILIIDKLIIDFFVELIKKNWINSIYKKIHKYIDVVKNVIELTKKDKNKLSIKDKKIERINYIMTNLLNSGEINKFLIKYIMSNKSKWNNIENHMDKIKNDIPVYLLKKINTTLE